MKKFLYFLLGFGLVFYAGLSFALTVGTTYPPSTFGLGSNFTQNYKITSILQSVTEDRHEYLAPGTTVFASFIRITVINSNNPSLYYRYNITYTDYAYELTDNTVTPPPCLAPNAVNPSGQCVPCPSGVFSIGTNACAPLCNFANPYIPGEIYNPMDGQGTCIAPPCGSGQTADVEGRCRPNCPTDKKLDIVTGACVADCPYGTTWDTATSTCKSDCPAGLMKDAETGSCIEQYNCDQGMEIVNGRCAYNCLPGETRDREGKCKSPVPSCPFGQHLEEGKCVSNPVNCQPGQTWDSVALACKPAPSNYTNTKQPTVTNPDGSTTDTTINITQTGGDSSNSYSTTTTTVTAADGTETTTQTFTPGPNNAKKYKSPEHKINYDNFNSQVRNFSENGPVKLFEHIKGIVGWFNIQPQTPSFTTTIGGQTMTFSLHAFDGLAEVVRFLLSCGSVIGVVYFGFKLFGLQ